MSKEEWNRAGHKVWNQHKHEFLILIILVIIACLLVHLLIANLRKSEAEPIAEPIAQNTEVLLPPEEVPLEEPEEDFTGKVQSKLTGLWIPEEDSNNRPYAIMFNNLSLASPQSGIAEAGVLYEILVEGGITRMLGIIENPTADRIGSVRSARHYYVSFAYEYDAIFAHYGHTSYATDKINALGINNLSGLSGIGTTVYYRDRSIVQPHNAFASAEGLLAGATKLGYRLEYEDSYQGHFNYETKVSEDLVTGQTANKITLGYSQYTSPYLVYDSESKKYLRYQFGGEHIDYNTKEQLSFQNILIQFVKEYAIDKNGYQTMDLDGTSGEGYYASCGKVMLIYWSKSNAKAATLYYSDSAHTQEITMNPGKTFISVFPNNRLDYITIE